LGADEGLNFTTGAYGVDEYKASAAMALDHRLVLNNNKNPDTSSIFRPVKNTGKN